MTTETHDDISVATLRATSEGSPLPPRALAETALWATYLWNSWWLLPIVARVVVPLARAGTYDFADILLVLIAHACGSNTHLRETLREFSSFERPLMALWGRRSMPEQSTLSRWLARISSDAVEQFRPLFCLTSATTA